MNTNEEFCSIVRTRLKNHSLGTRYYTPDFKAYFTLFVFTTVLENESIELFIQLLFSVYGGEVDCFQTSNDGAHYVELKTSRVIETEKQDVNFRRYVRQLL